MPFIVSEVSAILVAITTFLAPGGVGSKILAYISEGKVEYIGHIMSSAIFVPSPRVLYYSISWAVSISSCPVKKIRMSP